MIHFLHQNLSVLTRSPPYTDSFTRISYENMLFVLEIRERSELTRGGMSFLNCKGQNQVNEHFWRVVEFEPFLRGKNRFGNDRKIATSFAL